MTTRIGRRAAMGGVGAVALAGALGATAEEKPAAKVIGIATSARKGMTTAAAVTVCLEAVREANPAIETELIELAELSIPAQLAAGQPLREGETDDFPGIAEKLADPAVVGLVIGSPVYFGNMSALCKAFLDRCITLRKQNFALKNKVAGAVAVGGARNGGQEMTIQSIQAALSGQNVILVNTGPPTTRIGGTFWNQDNSIADDAFGHATAQDLGRRIVEVAGLRE